MIRYRNLYLSKKLFVIVLGIYHQVQGQNRPALPIDTLAFFYPYFDKTVTDFSLLRPDVVLVSTGGGVYMAGTNVWFLAPSNDRIIVSSAANEADGCLYYLSLKRADNSFQTSLHRLRKNKDQTQIDDELASFISDGMFQLFPLGKKNLFLLERGNNSKIWFYDGAQKKEVFNARKPITAFCPIDENNYLFALRNKIFMVREHSEAILLITVEENLLVDGICINDNNQIYFSTHQGIWKSSAGYDERPDYKLVLPKLHGTLKFLYPYLFIHTPKASTVIRIITEKN